MSIENISLKNEDFSQCIISICGKNNKNDGFLSNIIFATANGKTASGEEKSLSLVIKMSKEGDKLRKETPIKETFKKEIYIYDRVVPAFDAFQGEMGEKNFLDFMPKCYATRINNESELLVLENLKAQGYDLWDRKKPMTYDHIKLILGAYGRWHAFSLILKKQKPGIFEKLTENNINIFSYWPVKLQVFDYFLELFEKARNASNIPFSDMNKVQFTKSDIESIYTDLVYEEKSDHVILHCDCWTNNFMFKTEETTKKPSSVRIIDWQLSGLASPIMDLSFFIYTCVDTASYKNVQDLLKIYHNSLSECLSYFGCDTDQVFPYKKLVHHWKKFSRYGLIISVFVLRFSLCDANDAPDFADEAEQGKFFIESCRFPLKDEDIYFKRMRNNFLHYIENLK